jgi:hypothetical protein
MVDASRLAKDRAHAEVRVDLLHAASLLAMAIEALKLTPIHHDVCPELGVVLDVDYLIYECVALEELVRCASDAHRRHRLICERPHST